jgi:hypothetical protein
VFAFFIARIFHISFAHDIDDIFYPASTPHAFGFGPAHRNTFLVLIVIELLALVRRCLDFFDLSAFC